MIPTKEYPDKDEEVIVNEFSVNYSQRDVDDDLSLENLQLEIKSFGGGFFFKMQTEKWSFENIDDLIKILTDFKAKSGI